MIQPSGVITLLTDFGESDAYVGAMRGKILSLSRDLVIADISHNIPQGDIAATAFVLSQAAFCYPPGTVHCTVVDPGVGSRRAGLVVEAGEHFFVGPDNGIFTSVFGVDPLVYRIEKFQARGRHTFHGRDLFAPVAARVASGMDPHDVGPNHDNYVKLSWNTPVQRKDMIQGEVIHIDGFGNLITNIEEKDLEFLGVFPNESHLLNVEIAGRGVQGLCRTFSDKSPNTLVVYIGSAGKLEMAVRDGDAAEELNVERKETVTCRKINK